MKIPPYKSEKVKLKELILRHTPIKQFDLIKKGTNIIFRIHNIRADIFYHLDYAFTFQEINEQESKVIEKLKNIDIYGEDY